VSRGRSSPGVRFPFKAGPRLGCPCSGFASSCLRSRDDPTSPGIASPGVLAPSSATTTGAPSSLRRGLATTAERVEVAKPPPVPSSGFLPLSTVLAALAARTRSLRIPPFAVAPRRFAALFHAARAPGVALQSFPLSRSRTRSRGPRASLRVRVRPPHGAARSESFAAPFAGAPTSRHGWPEGSPDCEAGTTVPWSR